MASKNVRMFNSRYSGDYPPELSQAIENVIQTENIPNLEYAIYDFPEELIVQSIRSKKSIRKILEEQCTDRREYREKLNSYKAKLRDYQTVGVAFMYFSPTSILADKAGIGKTAQAAGLINVLDKKEELNRFLMAVEKSAVNQTQIEMIRRTGLNIISMMSNQVDSITKNANWNDIDGIIVPHSVLKNNLFYSWVAKYLNESGKSNIFNTMLIDESSVVKGQKTIVHNYVKELSKVFWHIHYLNATPFEIDLMEVYNQIKSMNENILPTKSAIRDRYCIIKPIEYYTKLNGKSQKRINRNNIAGYKNEIEFRNKIGLFCLSRYCETEENINHNYSIEYVHPTEAQCKAMSMGLSYDAILNCPSLLYDTAPEWVEQLIPFSPDGVPKLAALLKKIESKYMDKQVMIYCFNINAQYVIKRYLDKLNVKCSILNGGVISTNERQGLIDGFNNKEYQVLITNVKKSLNLYNGDCCILYSLETNPSKMEQIIRRIDRHVDDKVKDFILMIYKDTPEFRLLNDSVMQRANDAKNLIINAKTAVEYFMGAEE